MATIVKPVRARRLRLTSRTVTGALIVLLFLLPVLYVVLISFESNAHFLRNPMGLQGGFDASNFSQAWSQAGLGRQLVNTVIYSVAGAALATVLALLIAFPVARRLIRGSNLVYGFLAVGLFLPLAIIPLFIEAQKLGLWNNGIGYIILHIEPGLPLGLVVLVASISAVPTELDEAAIMDGATYLRYLWRVVVPLVRPGLFITFLYAMLGVWNDIIGPVILLSNTNLYPLTRGIYTFYGENAAEWGLLAAAVVIASLPLVALFTATQRQLIRVAVAGAVKQ
jgi:raffinose/stachyose/melibiose transport system permease protein